MKRTIAIMSMMVLLCICGEAAGAELHPSIENDSPCIRTHQSTETKHILLYTTRDYGTGIGARRWDYDEDLVDILSCYGFDVATHDRETIDSLTAEILADYDQLWLVSTESTGILSADEVQAIHDFHDAGKGLMIIGDSYTYDGPANQVSDRYGVSLSLQIDYCGGPVGCPFSTEPFPNHVVWRGVHTIECNKNEGHITAAYPVQVIATYNLRNMAAVVDDGTGRIAWDATWYRFTDATAHPDLSIRSEDNAVYVRNLAVWLDGGTPPAQLPYVGLFADVGHQVVEKLDCTPYEVFSVYIYYLAGGYGQNGGALSIELPDFVVLDAVTWNNFVNLTMGDILTGVEFYYESCYSGWHWPLKIDVHCTEGGYGFITVAGHPPNDDVLANSCCVALSEKATIYNEFGVCCEGVIATQLASFSASYATALGGVELNWTLSETTDAAEFVLQRSRGSGSDFMEIEDASIQRDDLTFSCIDRTVAGGESYTYRLDVIDEERRRTLFVTDPVATPVVPLALEQNHPNPFNPATTIRYHLPRDCDVSLEVFDVTGRRVAVLARGSRRAGDHSIVWDGKSAGGDPLSSGIYLYRLTAGKESISRKMLLMR